MRNLGGKDSELIRNISDCLCRFPHLLPRKSKSLSKPRRSIHPNPKTTQTAPKRRKTCKTYHLVGGVLFRYDRHTQRRRRRRISDHVEVFPTVEGKKRSASLREPLRDIVFRLLSFGILGSLGDILDFGRFD